MKLAPATRKIMSIILYRETDEGWETGMFEVPAMHQLLQSGWVPSKEKPEELDEEPETPEEESEEPTLLEDMSNKEIRALAKAANLENWDDARIITLIGKLRALNGNTEG